MKLPPLKRLRQALRYNRKTGQFRWRIAPNGRIKVGQIAGSLTDGYVIISLDGVGYRAHHLAWLYVKGRRSKHLLDHRNLRRSDNRILNLRPATRRQNSANKRCYRNSISGIKGVYLKNGRWRVQVRRNGTTEHVGYFDTRSKATQAYRAEAKKVFGDFVCFRGKAAA